MALVASLVSARRNVVPYLLVFRLLTLTSSASLALVVNQATAQAASPSTQITQTIQDERFSPEDFLAATNAAREAEGIAPLHLDPQLVLAATNKAIDMKVVGYWDHFRPSDGKAPWDFIKEAGYNYTIAGENLARGFSSVQGITNAWLNSPPHRANLMSPKYSDVGFADIETTDTNGNQVLLTVQMFGNR